MTVCCPARRPLPLSKGLWQECSCAVLGGLLCSSCCIVQLLLNLFSIGCAGFSTLTPYRPYFLSATATVLLGNFLKYRNKRRTALAVAVAFGLTVTPEIIQIYNKDQLPSLSELFGQPPLGKAQDTKLDTKIFSVSGLKCQACCARLKRHILENAAAEFCNVDFNRAEVHIRGSDLRDSELIAIVEQLGYTATLRDRTDFERAPAFNDGLKNLQKDLL